MAGFENWMALAVTASFIPFVKAKPQEILDYMVTQWGRPEKQQQSEQQMFDSVVGFFGKGKATIVERPADDPYWEERGLAQPEGAIAE